MSTSNEIILRIDSLSHGGSGVGRQDDLVIFVPFTAPGDVARVRITSQKKNYAEAELVSLETPSEHRATPVCPVFKSCGGCQWQHVGYEEQLRQKSNIVQHALSRIAREDGVSILPIIASPKKFNYRNRIQVRADNGQVGFYQRKTRSLVGVEKCYIAEEAINKELMQIRAEENKKLSTSSKKYEVFLDQQGAVHRSTNRNHSEETGFSQVNTEQNLNLQSCVSAGFGSPTDEDRDLLDLYCGNGNLSLPLNKAGWRIYGIDMSRQAIRQARERTTSTTFFSVDDCVRGVKKLTSKNRRFHSVLLDPPRIGADEELWSHIAKLEPRKLIYVSCNPATFARDWARIKARIPLKLESVQPLDMFPQTFHVELVAVSSLSK